MGRDGEGFQGVRTLRHQVHGQRCVIVVIQQVDLAKAEVSWDATQPTYDGGSCSAYLKGSGELGRGGRRDPCVSVIVVGCRNQRQIFKKGERRDEVEDLREWECRTY